MPTPCTFCFYFCYVATQLALQIHQTRIQLAYSNREARQRPAKSNDTPALDLEHTNVILKWCMCMLVVNLGVCVCLEIGMIQFSSVQSH